MKAEAEMASINTQIKGIYKYRILMFPLNHYFSFVLKDLFSQKKTFEIISKEYSDAIKVFFPFYLLIIVFYMVCIHSPAMALKWLLEDNL